MQFNITFDPASPDLASLTADEQQAVLDTANAAAAIWAWYLPAANITLSLQLTVDNSKFSGNVLAQGGPEDFIPTSRTFNGQRVYDANTDIELRTGQDVNGSAPDLSIDLTVSAIRSMLFKTDDYAAVPANASDALSVFLHEIGHGLGMVYLSDDTGTPGAAVYDTFVQNGRFIGPNAMAVYGTSVPLEPGSLAHVSESQLGLDLMSPTLNRGVNEHISALDLAILQDIGVPILQATSGNDVLHAVTGVSLHMGAGNDTGYALAGGSTIFGEDGNDHLIGGRGRDSLYGGNGDDDLTGSGGNDTLYGDAGVDVAHFSGLATDYQVTHAGSATTVTDMRPGSPDGTDTLSNIEEAQWGDGTLTILDNYPTITVFTTTLNAHQTVALSSLFSASDADGDAITRYQLIDNTSDLNSGHFTVNGTAVLANTVLTLTAGQLLQAGFTAGTVGDSLQVRAFDDFSWNAPIPTSWTPITIAVAPNRPPVVSGNNIQSYPNSTLQLSSLFSVSDPDGDAIVQYQLYDASTDPNSGHIVANGAAQPAGTVITLTAAQFAQATFATGTAGDTLQLRVFDGTAWSAPDNGPWTNATISPLSSPPVVTAPNATEPVKTTVPFSSLFSVSSPRAITKYEILEWSNGGSNDYSVIDGLNSSSGYLLLNGVLQPATTSSYIIDAGQLPQLSYVSGTALGDFFYIRAFDGQNWSSPDIFSGTALRVFLSGPTPFNHRPELGLGTRVPGSGFYGPLGSYSAQPFQTVPTSAFSFTYDADGDAITQYQILDNTTDPNSGHWLVDGVAQPAGTVITITASQFQQASFVTGTIGDDIQIRAFDGKDWSATPFAPYYWVAGDYAFGDLKISVPNTPPVVTTADKTFNHGQLIPLSSLFSVSDADGNAMTKYQLWDSTADPSSGYFVINGAVQAAATVINISPADLAVTYYATGLVGDGLQIRAFDGQDWSAADNARWSPFTTSILPNSPPVLTTADKTLGHGQTVALSSLFSVTDADSDTMTRYQLWDSTTDPNSGHFVVNGQAQPAATVIDITAGQLAQTSFVAGTVGDGIQIRAYDGYAWSAADTVRWAPFTVTVPVDHAPVLTTTDMTLGHGQSTALSGLFTVSDADNDTMTRYQLWDSTTDPNSGHFVVNGVAQPAASVIDISAAQLALTSFVAGTAGDGLQIRSFDGAQWSAADTVRWAPFTVTVPVDHAPVLTTTDRTVLHGRSVALSSLFSVSDADNDTMTRYQLWDSTTDPNSGYFTVNGVAQPAATVIDITAAQLAQTSFVAGTVGDGIQIRGFDGALWSSADNVRWAPFTVTVPNDNPPVLTTGNLTLTHGQSVGLSSLFTVTDADNDSMTRYQLWDSTTDPNSGHFVVNGVAQPAATVIDITAAQLAQTDFVAGTVGDGIQIRAYDGVQWSAADNVRWAPFLVTVPTDNPPVLTTGNTTMSHGQSVALSSLFTVTDADNDSITRYQLWDSTIDPNSGHFVVNGVAQPAAKVIDITAAQLAQTTFVSGVVGDGLQIRAFDGAAWSAADNARWAPFTITVPDTAPVLTTTDTFLARGQSVALSSLFAVSDTDGDAMTRYQLWDSTSDPNSGHFVVNGAVQPAATVIDITAGQLAQTSFVAGTVNDGLQIRAFDGAAWSAADNSRWAPFTVSVPADHAPVLTTADTSVNRGRSVFLSSLFSVSDADGDSMTRYQLWDSTADPNSGHFVVNGQAQPAATVIDITATQLTQTFFVAGTVDDNLQIRAFDGTAWSAADNTRWAPFHVAVT